MAALDNFFSATTKLFRQDQIRPAHRPSISAYDLHSIYHEFRELMARFREENAAVKAAQLAHRTMLERSPDLTLRALKDHIRAGKKVCAEIKCNRRGSYRHGRS